jgi:hypothetical protein
LLPLGEQFWKYCVDANYRLNSLKFEVFRTVPSFSTNDSIYLRKDPVRHGSCMGHQKLKLLMLDFQFDTSEFDVFMASHGFQLSFHEIVSFQLR